jgi:LAO/AO transport system kinase
LYVLNKYHRRTIAIRAKMSGLVKKLISGDRAAISKVITILEEGLPGSREIYSRLYRVGGNPFVVGFAGPPGSGKSTLINCLAKEFRSRGMKVGVVAVDPSSPLSGGALLGDRVRMLERSLDEGVFIRSMASRGSTGGLSVSTRKAILVLGAAGYDTIFVETVGVGQTELDIARVADVTVVVLMPQTGDEIQAMKAGLLEIGDVFAMNKSDLQGSDMAVLQLNLFLKEKEGRKPPVIRTVASSCRGVEMLALALLDLKKNWKGKRGRKEQRATDELRETVRVRFERLLEKRLANDRKLALVMKRVADGRLDPESAADIVLQRLLYGVE